MREALRRRDTLHADVVAEGGVVGRADAHDALVLDLGDHVAGDVAGGAEHLARRHAGPAQRAVDVLEVRVEVHQIWNCWHRFASF
jgi:hypothetical protein